MQVYVCEICGNQLTKPVIQMTEVHENWLLCPRCATFSGTCNFCQSASSCAFEQSNINIPKTETVIRNIQGGQAQMTIKNRARIDATCKAGCPCWDSVDECCNKEIGTCGNYKVRRKGNAS